MSSTMRESAATSHHHGASSRALPATRRGQQLRGDENDELVLKTQVCGLLASTAFLLGSLLLLQTVALLKVLAGFLVALQLIPEIHIDSFQSHPRCVSHGRYSAAEEPHQEQPARWSVLWNKTQNAVFLMACVLQIVAFGVAVQLERQPELFQAYQIFNLAAAATWVLSGLVVLLNHRLYWPSSCGRRSGCTTNTADEADVLGNALYVLGCLSWLIAGIAIFRSNTLNDGMGLALQRGAAGLWSVAALLHVATDVGRLCHRNNEDRKIPCNNPATPPPPTIRNETASSIGEDDSQA